jgi:hypothetical protein
MKKITVIFLFISAFILLACNNPLEKVLEDVVKDTDTTTEEQTVNMKTPEADVTMSNQEIPKDYPDSLCPIYQPSDILGVMDTKDPELRIMIISLLTEDSVEEVINYYQSKNPQENFGMDVMLFSSEDEKQEISVQVNSTEGEDVDEKYNALIVISFTETK